MARLRAAGSIAEHQGNDAHRVAALQERLTELEQTGREMREQLFDELRIAETKLSVSLFSYILTVVSLVLLFAVELFYNHSVACSLSSFFRVFCFVSFFCILLGFLFLYVVQ